MAIAIRKGPAPFQAEGDNFALAFSYHGRTAGARELVVKNGDWRAFRVFRFRSPNRPGSSLAARRKGAPKSNRPGQEFSNDVAFDKLFTSAPPIKLIESRR